VQNIRLNNPSQVKRLINRTINQLLNNEIETDKARCIGYLGSILLKATEVEEMELRLVSLEKQLLKAGA
jgi:hypothetical protein